MVFESYKHSAVQKTLRVVRFVCLVIDTRCDLYAR